MYTIAVKHTPDHGSYRDEESLLCLQGFREPSPDALDETEALILATQWKRKFHRHRMIEQSNAGTDDLAGTEDCEQEHFCTGTESDHDAAMKA